VERLRLPAYRSASKAHEPRPCFAQTFARPLSSTYRNG
jgi:hypothetical protein